VKAPRAFFWPALGARANELLRRFRRDSAGAVAVIVAITAPVLIGAMGLGSEAGYWYLTQRKVQSAADTAAHGAARRMAVGDDVAQMTEIAEYLAGRSGVDMDAASVMVNRPPISGGFAGNGSAVEVTVTETVPRLFTAIWTMEPVPITARAVALVQSGGTGCVLALSDTEGAITVSGSSESTLSLCDMVSNATGTAFIMSGSGSSVSANCIQTVGTAEVTGNLQVACASLREHAAAVADPFADVEDPALSGACQSATVGQNNTTTVVSPIESHTSGMQSRRYCNGLELSGDVVFEPGLYLIEGGDFRINSNAQVSGDGVVFYLAAGVSLQFNGTAMLDLSAPSSGPYAGLLIFGSRDSTGISHAINGNVGSTLDGAIYAPTSRLTISGNAQTSANGCTQFVTGTVTFTGSGSINISCEDPAGPSIEIAGNVSLVE
jgi:Flp pilus assembly protein TadG